MTDVIDCTNKYYRNLFDVLDECATRQICLSADGQKLHYEASQGAMTPELRAAMGEHKAEIMHYLAGDYTVRIKTADDPVWRDPRPDLKDDSRRWSLLLEKALEIDVDVFGMLNVLRGMGARLEIAGPETWSLRPEGPLPAWQIARGADMTAADFDDFRRRYLLPHAATLDQLLKPPAIEALVTFDPAWEPLRIPLTWDQTPSEYLAERGLRIVGGDPPTATLFVVDTEVAA